MTPEQINDLLLQFKHIHPEAVKQGERYEDDTFDDFARELEEESDGVLYPEQQVVTFDGDVVSTSVPSPPLDGGRPVGRPGEWEEIEF